MISSNVNDLLHVIVTNLQTPVVIILLVLMVATVMVVGSFCCEYVLEHRKLREDIPNLIEKINHTKSAQVGEMLVNARLLPRQKKVLKQLIDAADMDAETRETYAVQMLFEEEEHYQKNLRWPQTISKLGPMFGLLGTLVPLGPGLMALGQGNTELLSQSLLVAFDTTAAGVVIAAIAMVVAQIRKQWYRKYTQALESIMGVVIDKVKTEPKSSEKGDAA